MSDVVIRAEGISKRYRIGQRTGYRTLRDSLMQALGALFRRTSPQPADTIWALKDVSFEIRQGEVVGIIGRNGAGKTTLLKILGRVTTPTEGWAEARGRVGSMLEVGTGFHPELTGRENIFLNGAILGMRRTEIRRKLDDIVAFADIGAFLDTPVKHYSSGLYMRLAFSVSAHLDSEILLVDEVLAVGDVEFQRRCLGRMGEVAGQGRTVLFVSHNLGAIANLCQEVVWIDAGRLRQRGDPAAVIEAYLRATARPGGELDLREPVVRQGPGPARFRSIATRNVKGALTTEFEMGDAVVIECELASDRPLREVRLSLDVKTSTGVPVYHLVDEDCGFTLRNLREPRRVRVTIPAVALYPGTYLLSCWVGNAFYQGYDYVQDCLSLHVTQSDFTSRKFTLSWTHGVVLQPSHWEEAE